MPEFKEPTAYVVGDDIRVRHHETLVCFDLNNRRWLVFGLPADILALKVQAVKLKDWMLDDRLVLEAVMRGDKELGTLKPEEQQRPPATSGVRALRPPRPAARTS
jgi:hypothetical protein